ncbi:TIGR01457 family HAD-type hydrolase [Tumebacillus permanentifrigoris]|uniref:Acid sugar phosphatase n=1 Tax=Tumebacillus permanentifrigoris TaxID=378543 RepID=A0A316D580_9BACL|nr:TIGR01457 family HAD-type hydrolase [Tumebacillus permanentifrigoris]PWK08360.1 4-nitrophenyl phosphatase [Tumebacillus permanentifrigoris]
MNNAWLREIDAYLIDLDGTLYRGNEVIEDAPAFVEWLQASGKSYLYVTNNSSRTPEQVAEHLQHLGIKAEAEHVFTSSQVAAEYIKTDGRTGKRVFPVGEIGLYTALRDAGCQVVEEGPADYVVQGIDREFSYEKLKKASLLIQGGAVFISTNVDKALPTEEGLLPGSGSLAAAIRTASGTEPLVMGKPAARMIDFAVERLGVSKERSVVVGDNLETDILAGVQADVRTVLVLTGFSKREHIEGAEGQPTIVLESLTDLMKYAK